MLVVSLVVASLGVGVGAACVAWNRHTEALHSQVASFYPLDRVGTTWVYSSPDDVGATYRAELQAGGVYDGMAYRTVSVTRNDRPVTRIFFNEASGTLHLLGFDTASVKPRMDLPLASFPLVDSHWSATFESDFGAPTWTVTWTKISEACAQGVPMGGRHMYPCLHIHADIARADNPQVVAGLNYWQYPQLGPIKMQLVGQSEALLGIKPMLLQAERIEPPPAR